MVGLVRFEAIEPPKQIAEWQLHNSPSMKAHDQKPEKNAQIDALRLQLTEADNRRRVLLVALFREYAHDTAPIIETLFAEASRATLEKVESLLAVDLAKEVCK
ncbi:hypothetical protein IMCC26134_15200 [Verrucomicrobia bacterium IMCC26134]|jgi:hypothetical protein|nr:hypothetical protein IMCC26134_15200 [Verrucomicrobia bacterium IMCC26134]